VRLGDPPVIDECRRHIAWNEKIESVRQHDDDHHQCNTSRLPEKAGGIDYRADVDRLALLSGLSCLSCHQFSSRVCPRTLVTWKPLPYSLRPDSSDFHLYPVHVFACRNVKSLAVAVAESDVGGTDLCLGLAVEDW